MSLKLIKTRNLMDEYLQSCQDSFSEKFVGKTNDGYYHHSLDKRSSDVANSDPDLLDNSIVRLRGVTRLCSELLDLELTETRFPKKTGYSSLSQGTTFHRHIYHDLVCTKLSRSTTKNTPPPTNPEPVLEKQKPVLGKRRRRSGDVKVPRPKKRKPQQSTSCQCYEKFGCKTRKLSGRDTKLSNWMDCAKKVLLHMGLKHVSSELVVKLGSHATEIDALCIDREGSLVNVSWKTGYNKWVANSHQNFNKNFDYKELIASNENAKIAASHRLQQLCENHLFQNSLGGKLQIRYNLIIYVGCTANDSNCIYAFYPNSLDDPECYFSELIQTVDW